MESLSFTLQLKTRNERYDDFVARIALNYLKNYNKIQYRWKRTDTHDVISQQNLCFQNNNIIKREMNARTELVSDARFTAPDVTSLRTRTTARSGCTRTCLLFIIVIFGMLYYYLYLIFFKY